MATKQRLPAEVRKKEIREAAKRVFLKKGFTVFDIIEIDKPEFVEVEQQ